MLRVKVRFENEEIIFDGHVREDDLCDAINLFAPGISDVIMRTPMQVEGQFKQVIIEVTKL